MTESKGTISLKAFCEKFPKTRQAWLTYAEARLQHEQMKESATIAKKALWGCETALIDAMLDEEVPGVPDESGSYASMHNQWTIACNQENRVQVEGFLVDKFGDAEVFKTFILDKFAIREHLHECCQGNDPVLSEDEIPDFFDLKTHPRLNVKGWEGKRKEMEG